MTRVEVLVVLATLSLLALMALPLLAHPKPRSERIICLNNLRQIGGAFQRFGMEHEGNFPWMLQQGSGAFSANPWFQFLPLASDLDTAAVLFCPSGTGKMARDFSTNQNGGLQANGYRNGSISYFLGHPTVETPADFVCGDHNLVPSDYVACSYYSLAVGLGAPRSTAAWTGSMHGFQGNILMTDGRVEQFSNSELRKAVDQLLGDAGEGSIHVLR